MTATLMVSAKADIEAVPEGLHLGACVAIYDLGTLYNEKFDVAQRKAVLTWELPDLPPITVEKDGQKQTLPRCLSRRFTLSLNEKAHLRHVLESWRGHKFTDADLAGFDLAKVLGARCQVQVMHERGNDGRIFANVVNVLPAPKGATVKPTTALNCFSVSTLTEPKLPPGLPEWVGKLVKESRDWEKLLKKTSAPQPPSTPVQRASKSAEELPSFQPGEDDVPF